MFQIFGRGVPNWHDLELALRALLESDDETDRAVAWNCIHDHRVSTDREMEFLAGLVRPITAGGLKNHFSRYFQTQIRESMQPAFIRDSNKNNRVAFTPWGNLRPAINPHVMLARVLNLTNLRDVYLRNYYYFDNLSPNANRRHFSDWLDERCRAGDHERTDFVDRTLQMLNEDRRKSPFQPVWATPWAMLQEYHDPPERWFEVTGMKHQGERSAWAIVLAYEAYRVGELFRPTQLDASWFGYHFPGPDVLPPCSCGYAMDRAALVSRPLPEFVHQQADHDLRHWINADKLIRKVEFPELDVTSLAVQRCRHHDLLVHDFGAAARVWRQ